MSGFLHEGFPLYLELSGLHLESVVACIAQLLVTLCFLGLLPPGWDAIASRVGFENKPLNWMATCIDDCKCGHEKRGQVKQDLDNADCL